MTGREYQQSYINKPAGKAKAEAHRLLVGAERVVVGIAAPNYGSELKAGLQTSLVLTGEMGAFYQAFSNIDLDHAAVLEVAPPKQMYNL